MNNQDIDHESVQRLAYQLWQERGSPMGSPGEDWLRAEEKLRREGSADLSLSAVVMSPIEE